ncbi:MAG: hypothetical protein H5T97_07045 [Firmicutes bacterium]|nr:hypothetical protein [Bacillota bacterium]
MTPWVRAGSTTWPFANDACAVLGVEGCWYQGKLLRCYPFVRVYLLREGVTVTYGARPRY